MISSVKDCWILDCFTVHFLIQRSGQLELWTSCLFEVLKFLSGPVEFVSFLHLHSFLAFLWSSLRFRWCFCCSFFGLFEFRLIMDWLYLQTKSSKGWFWSSRRYVFCGWKCLYIENWHLIVLSEIGYWNKMAVHRRNWQSCLNTDVLSFPASCPEFLVHFCNRFVNSFLFIFLLRTLPLSWDLGRSDFGSLPHSPLRIRLDYFSLLLLAWFTGAFLWLFELN